MISFQLSLQTVKSFDHKNNIREEQVTVLCSKMLTNLHTIMADEYHDTLHIIPDIFDISIQPSDI